MTWWLWVLFGYVLLTVGFAIYALVQELRRKRRLQQEWVDQVVAEAERIIRGD